jgi:hypothetical protein
MVVLNDNTVSKETESSSGTNETDGRFWRRVSETDGAVQSQWVFPCVYYVGSKVAAAGRRDMTWARHEQRIPESVHRIASHRLALLPLPPSPSHLLASQSYCVA